MTLVQAPHQVPPLAKFVHPDITAKGESRAHISLKALETLWFNTGTLCNITCANCYIESSPRNDRLVYLTLDDVRPFLEEIAQDRLGTKLIGFTGGEPFMNAAFPAILEETLRRGFETLTLTNAMKPMLRFKPQIADLARQYGPNMRFRVSLDDYRALVHDAERGEGSFEATMQGIAWLLSAGVTLEIAGRLLSGDSEAAIRAGFTTLFAEKSIPIDVNDPQALLLLPEMTPLADPPEITPACWGILHKNPDDVMCASARMVVRRKEAASASVLACTLLPYDERFEMGTSLKAASGAVPLAHPWCASFCVLGGGSCGASRAG